MLQQEKEETWGSWKEAADSTDRVLKPFAVFVVFQVREGNTERGTEGE